VSVLITVGAPHLAERRAEDRLPLVVEHRELFASPDPFTRLRSRLSTLPTAVAKQAESPAGRDENP
jgi:hypothetical protein